LSFGLCFLVFFLLEFHEVVAFSFDVVVDGLAVGVLGFLVGFFLLHEVAVVVGGGEILDYALLELRGEAPAQVVEPVKHQPDIRSI
jgi:flagellar biosynthesis protein FliR